MPRKFKVGDRVRVVRIAFAPAEADVCSRVGFVAYVRRIDSGDTYPYWIKGYGWGNHFSARELEAAPKKAKKRGK
ncbi:MAG: hypothetical protein QGD90_00250 [Candidatus Hydrogenedentes bacterium]|nr:hypothetical protein [Candidatus Hydrogenedentota bacterium]